MILSRVWYVLLGLAVSVALYVVFVALGQFNRQTTHALKEGLASDSQTVEWALKIDARHRLDALLGGSVDATLQQALVAANGTKDGKLADKTKTDARKALATVNENIPADFRPDAVFAVDREGHVIAQVGYDATTTDDFELGGYPAVNDALHGWLRDDVWILGSRMFLTVARPVEYDVTQRPAGAIVGLKEVNRKFADDLSKRTRTNIEFFASGETFGRGVGVDGFDAEKLDAVATDLKSVDDKTFGDSGRSDVRMISDDLGTLYARLPGDAALLGGGFAVARSRTVLVSPMSFLSTADDKDKANVPWVLLVAVVLVAAALGVVLTLLEHSTPLDELLMQAERLKSGAMDSLQVARFRGSYRLAAQAINEGLERSIEKAGGVTRKPADLESILGPAPAQPSMSAFSFPMADPGPAVVPPVPPPPPSSPELPGIAAHAGPPRPTGSLNKPTGPGFVPPAAAPRPAPLPAAGRPFVPPPLPRPATPPASEPEEGGDDDATMVGAVPAELLAQATGENRAAHQDDTAEWVSVYEDFIRTKRQCGESTDGLTFEKFSHTLKKNRDQLMQKHACKRVKFSVYTKEGKASLKATPVKE
ncbi:MAG TPA: MXAN_5187 family protein [Polyangiaceae bacterium]|nr:MXAN_5187 family protein [Polyangiaceae bacterium]